MEEILHHLGFVKPCKYWDKLHISWCRISSINSISRKYLFRWHLLCSFAQKHLRFFTQSFPLCFSHPKFQAKSTGATKRSLITFHESSWLFNWDSYFHGIGFFPLQQRVDHPTIQTTRDPSLTGLGSPLSRGSSGFSPTVVYGHPSQRNPRWSRRFFGSPEIPPKTEPGGWEFAYAAPWDWHMNTYIWITNSS